MYTLQVSGITPPHGFAKFQTYNQIQAEVKRLIKQRQDQDAELSQASPSSPQAASDTGRAAPGAEEPA